MDRYGGFEELRREQEGSFVICTKQGSSDVAILAPHGGDIEPGTSEIAKAIAAKEHSYYLFEGRKRTGNQDLHITSANFDEPTAVSLAKQAERIIAIHGCAGRRAVVYLGGLDVGLRNKVRQCLIEAGFKAEEHSDPNLQGIYPNNICNRSKINRGVQLEIADALRERMFEDVNNRKGRQRTTPTFDRFVFAVRQAISSLNQLV